MHTHDKYAIALQVKNILSNIGTIEQTLFAQHCNNVDNVKISEYLIGGIRSSLGNALKLLEDDTLTIDAAMTPSLQTKLATPTVEKQLFNLSKHVSEKEGYSFEEVQAIRASGKPETPAADEFKPLSREQAEGLLMKFSDYVDTDDESYDNKGSRLYRTYMKADKHSRLLMDDVFITLCGFSLDTIIKEAVAEQHDKEISETPLYDNSDAPGTSLHIKH